jgi:glutathione S-transferase
MKLYTFPAAPNPRKVHAVIEHLGITGIEIHLVDLGKGEQRSPEYLAVNPMGRVPTLVDGDLVLWESNAICEYLCDLQGDTSLFPRDAKVRADISRWLFWQASDWLSATGPIAFENFVKKFFFNAEPDAARVEAAQKAFHNCAGMLNKHLEGRQFIVGNQFTLADIAVASLLTFAGPARFPMENYGNITAFNARLDEIPAWKNTAPKFGP